MSTKLVDERRKTINKETEKEKESNKSKRKKGTFAFVLFATENKGD